MDAVERCCGNTAEKVALGLLLLLFTANKLRQGNCTKPVRKDVQELDSKRLWAISKMLIRSCFDYYFTGHVDYLLPQTVKQATDGGPYSQKP